ncbi:MAG TPA: hypothetical protein DEQ02_10905 [Ruminococcaceae bacterium]|nr:hypothetical protein [Oscillospiraceae bacterium]
MRRRRQKNGIPTAAIVGYTNAGKSTLMNALTKAGVLAMDRLFATLDPTARKLTLPDGRDILLIDTVGFIRKLPHHLIESFHSTLEEASLADLIIHVCDASSPYAYEQITVTDELLERLGCAGKPVITVLNKCDKSADMGMLPAKENSVLMSAKTGDGTDALLAAIMRALPNIRTEAALLIPYDDGEFAAEVRKTGEVKKEAYLENGLFMKVRIDRKTLAEAEKYLCDEDIL